MTLSGIIIYNTEAVVEGLTEENGILMVSRTVVGILKKYWCSRWSNLKRHFVTVQGVIS